MLGKLTTKGGDLMSFDLEAILISRITIMRQKSNLFCHN
jgi:hypothetical protein